MGKKTYRSTAPLPPVVLIDNADMDFTDATIEIPRLVDPEPDPNTDKGASGRRRSGYVIGFIVLVGASAVFGLQSIGFATSAATPSTLEQEVGHRDIR